MARPREFDKNEVLDKAMELFWYQGYEATSIQDLTQHMGISRGSLYDSFGDKRTLFITVLNRYGRQFHQQLQTMLTPSHSAREGIEQLFDYVVHDALSHPKRRRAVKFCYMYRYRYMDTVISLAVASTVFGACWLRR